MQVPVTIMRLGRQYVRRPRLPFPGASRVRAAQITSTTAFDRVTPFPRDRWAELQAFRPQVLVGPAADLLELATIAKTEMMDVSSVDHALFVLTTCGDEPLSDVSRVVLWQTFGVPVYELFVGRDNKVLASECEAHEGWHIEADADFFMRNRELHVRVPRQNVMSTGLIANIETAPCACGREAARVMDLQVCDARENRAALAATA